MSTSSVSRPLSLACILLLASGVAGAQKKKPYDPYAGMPPLPAPKLLNRTPAMATDPANGLASSTTLPAATPAAATAATSAPSNDAGSDASTTTVMASIKPLAPTPEAVPTPAPSTDVAVSTYAPSTGRTHSILSFDEYEHLLNIVLPLDHRSPPGLEYSLILRFEPHIHPESQIVIRHWRDGTNETAIYRVDKVNAWRAAYGNVADGQTPDFVTMSKQITVVRNSFRVQPADEAEWRKTLLPVLQKELGKARKKTKHPGREDEHEMLGNGTRYELWYIQGDSEMHFVSLDSEVDTVTKGNEDLTKWMNVVRSYADTHLTTYKPLSYSADEMKMPRTLISKNKK